MQSNFLYKLIVPDINNNDALLFDIF